MLVLKQKTNLFPFPEQTVSVFQEAGCFVFGSCSDRSLWKPGVKADSSSAAVGETEEGGISVRLFLDVT